MAFFVSNPTELTQCSSDLQHNPILAYSEVSITKWDEFPEKCIYKVVVLNSAYIEAPFLPISSFVHSLLQESRQCCGQVFSFQPRVFCIIFPLSFKVIVCGDSPPPTRNKAGQAYSDKALLQWFSIFLALAPHFKYNLSGPH